MRRGWTTWLAACRRTIPRRRTIGAIVISTLVHVTLLSACALWVLTPRQEQPVLSIRTDWNDAAQPELTSLEPLPVAAEPDQEEAGGESRGAAVFNNADGGTGNEMSVELSAMWLLQTSGHLAPAATPMQTVGVSTGEGLGAEDGVGRGGGTGSGVGTGEGGSFFGLNAEGRRVVYVVDASRSMNHPHPGEMKTRFGRVKLELVRSIGAMRPEQEFFIIYFNHRAWPMPAASMKLAIPSAQQKYLRWAVEVKASGQTDPEQALLVALKLRPDVIYFLTDGDFKPNVVDHVRAANHNARVVIHTIGFGDDGGEELLKSIAQQNWGTYQFIPSDEGDPAGAETR